MGYISLAQKIMPFLLELSLNIEHSLNCLVLFSTSHMLYLEAITQGGSMKCEFTKTRQTKYTALRYERMAIIEKINNVILVM